MTIIDTSSSERFSRERLAGYDPEVLDRAVVMVVGAGALGQSVLPNLALTGIGELRVVDFDEFEPHNASRSPYFPTASEKRTIGTLKSQVVAHKVRSQMLASRPVMRFARVPMQQLGLGAFVNVDTVISAVDNPRARAFLSDACRYLGIDLIEGGFEGPSVAMSCFPAVEGADADRQPCYRCGNPHLVGTFSCQRYAAEAAREGIVPAIQPAAAVLGGMMAEAAIQSVHGESPLGFKRTTLNVRTGEQRQYELTRAGNCPGIHGCLTEIPIDSSVQGSEPLANLIAFAEHEIGTGAQIELDEPFVVEAYCMSCGDVMKVEAPEWAYDMKPRCLNCSGPWTPIQVARGGGTPVKPIRIDATTDEGVLSMKCAKAGLVSLNLVQVLRADGSSSRVARMAGKLTDLFEEV